MIYHIYKFYELYAMIYGHRPNGVSMRQPHARNDTPGEQGMMGGGMHSMPPAVPQHLGVPGVGAGSGKPEGVRRRVKSR